MWQEGTVVNYGAQQPNRRPLRPVSCSAQAVWTLRPSTHWYSLAVALAPPRSHKWPLLVRGSPRTCVTFEQSTGLPAHLHQPILTTCPTLSLPGSCIERMQNCSRILALQLLDPSLTHCSDDLMMLQLFFLRVCSQLHQAVQNVIRLQATLAEKCSLHH